MIIQNFNVGDYITAIFSYEDNQLKYSNSYNFIEIDNQMYLESDDKTYALRLDENDPSSREFRRNFQMLEYPIIKINRHIKSQKRLYVILFLYSNYIKTDQFNMYYSNDFYREVSLITKVPLNAFIDNEFVLDGNIFYQANVSNKVVNLIGNSYAISAQQIEKNVFRLDRISRKSQTPTYNITNLHFDLIKVQKIEDYLREKQKSSGIILTEPAEVKYVQFWQEYLKVEKNQTIIDLYNAGSYRYNGYKIDGYSIVLNLENNNQPVHFEKGMMVSYFVKPIKEMIQYRYNDKLYKADLENINQEHELEIIDEEEMAIGIVQSNENGKLIIGLKNETMPRLRDLPKTGFLSESYLGSKINYERKKAILSSLRDKGSYFLKNIVLYGSLQGLEEEHIKVSKNTIKTETLKAMFGRDDIEPTDNQKEAIRIALTTPDIALIQGPPGTGKTTIIKGLISRIKSLYNYPPKILVATEQHEALHNVVYDVNTEIPPTIISFRQSDDESEKLTDITFYQEKLASLFEGYLQNHQFKDNKTIIYEYIYTTLDKHYDKNYILSKLPQIVEIVKELNDNELLINLKALELACNRNDIKKSKFKDEFLQVLLSSQRTEADSYSDDGEEKLNNLLIYLEISNHSEYEKFKDIYSSLQNNEEVYDKYRELVDASLAANKIDVISSNQNKSVKDLFDDFSLSIRNSFKKHIFNNMENVINDFLRDISNPYVLKETVKRYNSVFGSTCQQSVKFKRDKTISVEKFDYVIIDEASRVNPVDLLIPMSMGFKVILVGDQKQLPHYLENENVKQLASNLNSSNQVLQEVLRESLFERIFNLLVKESKIKRTITLSEQYRMNPILGKYISENFYDGKIKNGFGVENKINNYGIMNSKSVAWLEVGKLNGLEVRNFSGSLLRKSEADAIIDSIQEIAKKNYSDLSVFPSVGVISYYKAQVEVIKEGIEQNFPNRIKEKIVIGTVDSFQGKEFDIVYLSTVRANNNTDIQKRIGFLSNSPNRINVSLSRAKNLMVVVGDSETIAGNSKDIINKYFLNFKELCIEEGYYAN